MTMYVIAYYNNGWNISELMIDLPTAQNAFNWFQTLSGTTYVVLMSWPTTSISTWGTPPA